MARAADRPMRSQLVGPVLARVRERGGDPAALVDRFALPADAERAAELVLPLSTFLALLEAAAEAARDPFLGAHVAERVPRGTYGILEFSCRSAPTLGAAFCRVARYMSLLNELVEVTASEQDDEARLEQQIPGRPLCLGRHANEFFVVMLILQARHLTGAPVVPTRAWFAHPAPPDTGVLASLLGCDQLSFGQGANGLALPRRLLALPLVSSDPPLLSLLDQKAEEALLARSGPSRFLGEVRQRVRRELSEEVPSLERTARALGMSARTLQRRLGEEGSSFQQLVDSVRQELARLYVRDPKLPLGEVAYLLGYAELSAFLRAFKRWTGTTPTAFRAA